jgi:hypothetical protein
MYIVILWIHVVESVMNKWPLIMYLFATVDLVIMVPTQVTLVQYVMFATLALVINISAANRHVVQGCTWGVLKVMIADLVQKILTAQEEHLSLFPVHQGQ